MRKVCRKKVQDDKLVASGKPMDGGSLECQPWAECQAQLGIGERKLDRDERTLVFTSYSTMQY